MNGAVAAVKMRASAAFVVVACTVFALGCASTPPKYGGLAAAQSKDLHLQVGDVLDVKFTYWPELDEQQAIRPDGLLSLPLVGEVEAEGLTPSQFHARLLDLYKDKITDPEINVVVRSLESHRIYVGGEVKTPGMLPITGRMTALQAIMQAGGFLKESARMSTVVVVRQDENEQHAMTIDLAKALESADSEPFYLQPNDMVFVPRTAIDRVDQWVEQYVNKIVPKNLHYSFSDVLRDSSSSTKSSSTVQTQLTLPSFK